MRTLSSTSRALCVAAAVIAAALILGGAFFIGYIGEIQRDLEDPVSPHRQVAAAIASVEKSLGYTGFLKAYRNYRSTGDPAARSKMTEAVATAAGAIQTVRALHSGDPAAGEVLREAAAVTDTFAQIAKNAPRLGDAALRGTAAMEALSALPQSAPLEATYLSLRGALDRLRQAGIDHELGAAAWALNWTQVLLIAAVALMVLGLLIVAALLQKAIIQPLKALQHSLASIGEGVLGSKVWGVERTDEFGALARATENVRLRLTEVPALRTAKLAEPVAERSVRLDDLANRFDQNGYSLDQSELAAVVAKLAKIARALQALPPRTHAEANASDVESLTRAFRAECEAIRGEIRELAVRLTEDRLLATADFPLIGANREADPTPRRTLADVPGPEIMSRFHNLAAEMNVAQAKLDRVASLKDALTNFAIAAKRLATGAARAPRLKGLDEAFTRHADEIDAHAGAIDPSVEQLHGEVLALTEELRTIVVRVQTAGAKEDPALLEAAVSLGERAESLFARLADLPATPDNVDAAVAEPVEGPNAGFAALAQLTEQLEAQAESLARSALANRFERIAAGASVAGHDHTGIDRLDIDGAIRIVFESIERLNNIAASLARAGDAERLRRAAH